MQLAANDAYFSGNPLLLFLALTGAAEIHHSEQHLDSAVELLRQARDLIQRVSDQPDRLAYNLEHSMNEILTEALTQARESTRAPSGNLDLFNQMKMKIISAISGSLVNAAVCKFFNVGGGLSLSLFGEANYDMQSSVFNGVVAVGSGNNQRIG